MRTERYFSREASAPVIEIMKVSTKKYDRKVTLDESGISHVTLVERKSEDFLDVPFRDFSMQTMVATGEVARLQFVTPHSVSQLDALDNINEDASELSARLDHLEYMENAAATSKQSSVEPQQSAE